MAIYESSGERAIAMDYHLRIREAPQYLHNTATGKAMLAHFDETRIKEIIDDQGLVKRTEQTTTDPDELFAELQRIRDRGYAVNDEEEIRGMRSVGAPVKGVESDVWGAISVTAPTSRLSDEYYQPEIPELVMEAVNIIEVNIETAIGENP